MSDKIVKISGELIPLFKADSHNFDIDEITELFLNAFPYVKESDLEFNKEQNMFFCYKRINKHETFIFNKRWVFVMVEFLEEEIDSKVSEFDYIGGRYKYSGVWNKTNDIVPNVIISKYLKNEFNNKKTS